MSENQPTRTRCSRRLERSQNIETQPVEAVDYSAYYSREGGEEVETAEAAFAPPPKMDQYLMDDDPLLDDVPSGAANVYHTLEANWVDEDVRSDLQSDIGYEVREEVEVPKPKRKRKKKRRHTLRNVLIALVIVAMCCAGLWWMCEPITGLLQATVQPTQEPFEPIVTPEPIKAYDAAPAIAMADSASAAIAQLSGEVEMENHIVTSSHIVTRNLRKNGMYDFYLFTASEGRLLCYFEGLGAQDMIPLEGGGFYVTQEPYLIAANGSAMIRTADLEMQQEGKLKLHPLYNGWAIAENMADGSANYLNTSAHTISNLWFCRAFPFTGEYTLAYMDSGAEGSDQRYLLYVLGTDGAMSRWMASDHTGHVVACADGMAYMDDGSLYHLPDTSAPLLVTAEAHAYLDCGALVVRDSKTGKFGLFVHGEQHYDFVYDSIKPVPSDITWDKRALTGQGGSFTVLAVSGESYPLPRSHSFVLERDGKREYVALSTESSCPIRLEGEF